MKKRYHVTFVFETETNDELLNTKYRCNKEDLLRLKEFYGFLVQENQTLLEYYKNYCLAQLLDKNVEDFKELLGVNVHDDVICAPADLCKNETKEFIQMVFRDARKTINEKRLENIKLIMDDQFKICGISSAVFAETDPAGKDT